ncbi:sensor histidine kinase [Amycolatopsis nigrescens]|uniref:sensor histidine kinase n=1 Tax=Amycolatopsis nigrescens TaxID=381445 RepID=UPI000590C430|nr:histidine kinase [Amycolatopsis nigrescens]
MRATVLNGAKARLEAALASAGIGLPWWGAVCATGMGVLFGLVAIAQRAALMPAPALVLAGVLTIVSLLGYAITGEIAPPWLKAGTVLAAVAILLTAPVVPDFAPMSLVILTAEVAVTARPVLAFTVTGTSIVVLGAATVWAGLVGFQVYTVAVLVGLIGGFMLSWYVRALDAERGAREAAQEQAILAERQRIARDVHDVVAHSLSITLLHLTGARRALEEDGDVDEAIDGLTDAERAGRAAMADIRRTVALLAGSSSGTRPLPGVDDIAVLVERTRAAGLDVRYEQEGDLTAVGASDGLGLYRIAQESLTNIAKHAPDASAEVLLWADAASTRLTVRNGLPAAVPSPVGSGSGLPGMSARAEQLGGALHAGPSGEHWVVDIMVPGPQARAEPVKS